MPGRTLGVMSTSTTSDHSTNDATPIEIFTDPVAYLARLGIDSELVAETTLPVAA